jgi:AAA15 family ATPase/GTPase
MLLEYQITNFKSFSGPVNIPIKPITLIFGPNSSGKSSIFQSLLMLKQTFEEGRGEVLKTRGDLIDLGSFKEFISGQNLNRSFSFKMSLKKPSRFFPLPKARELGGLSPSPDIFNDLERSINFEKIAISKTYTADRSSNCNTFISKIELFLGDKQILSYHRKGLKKDFSIEYNYNHDYWPRYWETFDKDKRELTIRRKGDMQYKDNIDVIFKQYISFCNNFAIKKPQELSGLINSINKLVGFKKALAVYKRAFTSIEDLKCFLQGDESQAFGLYGSRGIEPILMENFPFLYSGQQRDPSFFREVTEELMEEYLSNIVYIGPLRDFPQRYYMLDKLPAGFGSDFWTDEKFRSKQALLKINKEIKKYGLDYEFRPSIIKNDNLNIMIGGHIQFVNKKSRVAINLKDMGFGYSQILPIIIQGLLSQEKTILVEQPEIHLHPALQAEIGDLFIEAALGKQKNTFLVETHSEHLILRILRRIRETASGELPTGAQPITPDQLAVLYVQQGKNGAEVINIPVTEDGDFAAKWPSGFFTEREKELF